LRQENTVLLQHVVLYVAGKVLQGLDYIHRRQIVHRDVSPHNILVSVHGEVKIADFGVAKVLHTHTATTGDFTGVFKGKLAYMSPEQARGETVDGRTDLYATGLVLYELISGKRFLRCETPFELIRTASTARRPVPHGVTPELAAVVEGLLEPDPHARFQTAQEVVAALPLCDAVGPKGAFELGRIVKELAGEEACRHSAGIAVTVPNDSGSLSGATEATHQTGKFDRRERPIVSGSPDAETAVRPDAVLLANGDHSTHETDALHAVTMVRVETIQVLSTTVIVRDGDEWSGVCAKPLSPALPQEALINGRYRVLDKIGRGGMGVVFLVSDELRQDRNMALKMVNHPEFCTENRDLLRAEFQVMASFQHPNLASVLDFEALADSDELFFTMEYVEGQDLLQTSKGMGWRDSLGLVVQLCRALAYVHRRGVVHHDLKPANVLVTTGQDNDMLAKVLDFGLASAVAAPLMGTPAYMAPERWLGHAVDHRADLYSLGILCYEMLCQRHPFSATSLKSMALAHIDAALLAVVWTCRSHWNP